MVVYRLISCGTIEEVIYRKQVYKGLIANTAIQSKTQHRYFNAAELREVFSIPDSSVSMTARQLSTLHPVNQRRTYPALDDEIQFVNTLGMIYQLSNTIIYLLSNMYQIHHISHHHIISHPLMTYVAPSSTCSAHFDTTWCL